MSMIAKFARITPWRLKEIIADPDLATQVFDESEAAPGTPHTVASGASMIPPASAEIIRRASAALATSMASMNPEMQSRVQQAFGNLGIDPASLAGEKGGEKLLELMRQRVRSMNTAFNHRLVALSEVRRARLPHPRSRSTRRGTPSTIFCAVHPIPESVCSARS